MDLSKQEALDCLAGIVGQENIITDDKVLREYDSDNDSYAKAFGIFQIPIPMCIVNVSDKNEISSVIRFCNDNHIAVIPRTGASSYEGLLSAQSEESIVVDASKMNRILEIDTHNMMATTQCGVPLAVLESTLNKDGFTTGHGPQSLPIAQMGGLTATRSIGQFSTYYGGIEDLICGMEAVLSDGEIVRIRNVPRRASGPDLRHLLVGSEGGTCFITEVTVKIFHYYPESFWRAGYVVPSMEEGFEIIRKIITAGYRASVVRLYDKADYDYNYGTVELEDNEAFMFFLAEGPELIARATGEAIEQFAKEGNCRYIGTECVDYWMIHKNDLCERFHTQENRDRFVETESYYATTEISASWTDIVTIYHNVINRIQEEIPTTIMVGGHVSHSYQNGTNIYFVYSIGINDPKTASAEHQAVVDIICEEVLKTPTGGCAHHHSMGKMRVKFAPQEHGSSYILMKKLKKMMDPNNIMNPGVLVYDPAQEE